MKFQSRRRNGYRTTFQRRKVCRFCVDKSLSVSYKEIDLLQHFVTERGKIIPRRISGNCARHQRRVTRAIKTARTMALLPFTTHHNI
ncbi:MAG: 30S ribosomal protein S18 [Deltaproteobacteria bacterium]|nr:30S ribosomal protein S18 [Deltaproteobacteria bacterium]